MKLQDHYSEFRRTIHTCKCAWRGAGASMKNGKYSGLGINKRCPACGEFYVFARFSVLVEDDCPDDWPPVV